MAVEALGAVVLQKLTDLIIHDSIAFDNVIDQIEDIRIQLRLMRGFLIHAEFSHDPAAINWATKYLCVLFSVEDEIENYVLSLAARGRRNIGFFQRRGFTLFATVDNFLGSGKLLRRELDRLADNIRSLGLMRPVQVEDASLRVRNPSLNVMDTGIGEYSDSAAPGGLMSDQLETGKMKCTACTHQRTVSDQPHPATPWSLLPVNSPVYIHSKRFPLNRPTSFRAGSPRHHRHQDQEGSTLIGYTRDQKRLVDRLNENHGSGVIPLVGPAGSGKTTLVQTIYNLREVKALFNCRAWVHVPDEYVRIPQLLANLLQQVLKSTEGVNLNNGQLSTRVHDRLMEKKYLVVLDHITDFQYWSDLKSAFPNLDIGNNKVILITRDQKLATRISMQERCLPHHLTKLCDEHSWKLLTKKSGLDQKSVQLDNGFKDEILRKCDGCPLHIVLLGGLLSTKEPNCDEWKWYLSQSDYCNMEILPLSFNDLPAPSKLCLLYMALFPTEADISVRRLHRLWLAEGLVRRSPGMSDEDTVEECFEDLVQRNLIKISKLRSDGNPQRCHLPRELRLYLSPVARGISLFYIHQDHRESIPPNVRRVIEYVDIQDYTTPSHALSPYQNVRSYLSFNFQRNDTPAKEVGNFISKIIGNKGFGVLRVLDLEGVYKPTLPEILKQLFHLRYLGLRWTFIDHLPKSVGDLPYLETLDLKRTYINSLPNSIWKLKHLRHLNLPDIRLDYKQKKRHGSLIELRTLVGLIVDDETAVKDELSQLCELRELGITCQLSFCNDLMSWIQKLTNLRFLSLKSKDKMGRPSMIKLEPLSKLSELSHVRLLGNLEQLPTRYEFPPNLKVLALSVSRLTVDPMPVLSKLPRTCLSAYVACTNIFNKIINIAGDNLNYYDYRKKCNTDLCYDFSEMEKLLNKKTVREALGVGDIEFVSCSSAVYSAMQSDWMKNLETGIPELLEDGIKLLVYAGEYDLICNWLGNWRWVHAMEWSGKDAFAAAHNVSFEVDGVEAGQLKSHASLAFLKVHDAGHMVPMDQPKASLEMLRRWTQGELYMTGT